MNKTTELSLPKLPTIAIILMSIVGCGSETDSSALAKEVELERLRAEGTIIETVTIVGDQVRLKAGDTLQLSAIGVDSNGNSRDITNELTWRTSDNNIATINDNGLVTALMNSSINQGVVSITATTINDMFDEGEVSVSDTKAQAISLKQISPATETINTCAPAQITGDVTYIDGYVSLNTVRDMRFFVDENSSAKIDTNGFIYTSAAVTESTTITAAIDDVTNQLTVVADPKNLNNISLLLDNEETEKITLAIGDRVNIDARATYADSVTTTPIDINNSINWGVVNNDYIGLTKAGNTKGTLLAIKPGVTQLLGSCGGQQAIATVVVEGTTDIDSLQINDGSDLYTIAPLKSIVLKLTASYTTNSTNLNVSEFADWSLNDSNILDAELINIGSENAALRVTSNQNSVGSAILSVSFAGILNSIQINIE
ncbi:MAG: Ig-like domain-containing protein [Pseudoalteromonas prydzensis]|uniref:Ig-like domain-containing protein n=1 Tax=Pseudoalteromonas prydzensis TaxID=182141 RepID=A0ABR9FN17_9GAMM|nr:Ig-like domain-containing protein [Pseudoalteromonas prydzensis]MBE0458213.1 Ig-like domain-containing protein [Pseudoalteromonas prydzensis]